MPGKGTVILNVTGPTQCDDHIAEFTPTVSNMQNMLSLCQKYSIRYGILHCIVDFSKGTDYPHLIFRNPVPDIKSIKRAHYTK